ncbi:hypothetical protein D3C80_1634320 [compost metagenome]
MPIAGRTSSRKDSPGWGGLYIGIWVCLLVIVQIVYKLDIGTDEAEDQSPIPRNADRPEAFKITPQHVQAVSRSIHAGRGLRNIKCGKQAPKSGNMVSTHSGDLTTLIEHPQAFVPETPDHWRESVRQHLTHFKLV